MRRGIFGFDIWFYGIVALLLAVCQQPLVLGGLMLFVMLVEKDEWLNRQVMQALLMCLGVMAVSLLVHKLSAVFVIVPFFGWMLRWGVDRLWICCSCWVWRSLPSVPPTACTRAWTAIFPLLPVL